jgi:hypothetical protein
MAKKVQTEKLDTKQIYRAVENQQEVYYTQRKAHERRWYDNNFFDDGFHFRFLSRRTGKIVDLSARATQTSPKRAIPKASRQIRGIANLLLGLDPHPVIYPEELLASNYQSPEEYQKAREVAGEIAQKVGIWITEEWEEQELIDKLTTMLILSAKHGVSYLQILPDPIEECIKTEVCDAFDIFLDGSLTEIYDSPSIIKAKPQLIAKIKTNELFDEKARMDISPDNKYASSEVKQAYMNARFGQFSVAEQTQTLIVKEAFIKEYLSKDNKARVRKLQNSDFVDNKKMGDVVMRHTFSTSNGTLLDEYIDLPEYPFVDFRYEPGLIYQVPLIERFKEANKSLDIAMSRVEGFANTMITGIYQKRKGENYQVSNIPGGQLIEYESQPLLQMQPTSVPSFIFNYMEMLNRIIEEQGASASALGQLPSGVKSGVAIESLKQTEYANLKIPTNYFKKTVKRITKRLLDSAAKAFIDPQTVYLLDQGKPDYFNVIGEKGLMARQKAGLEVPEGTIVISGDYKVRIDVEPALGFTMSGKKDTMLQITQFLQGLAEQGYLTQDAVKELIQKFLETFNYGSTQEFMQAMESGTQSNKLNEDQLTQMKIAVVEAMRDAGVAGQDTSDQDIQKTKIGVVEALQDLAG